MAAIEPVQATVTVVIWDNVLVADARVSDDAVAPSLPGGRPAPDADVFAPWWRPG